MKLTVSLTLTTALAAALVGCQEPPSQIARGATDALAQRARPTVVVVAPSPRTTPPTVVAPDRAEPAERLDLDAELGVKRLVIAQGVKDREPVDPAVTFASNHDGPIYAFVEVSNADRVASEIYVSFVREGEPERAPISLRVGSSPRWRTWATTRLAKKPGAYFAIVRDAAGKELGRERFEVRAEPAAPVPAA
jgi:hypothetical protein